MKELFVDVALPVPLNQTFTYKVAPELRSDAAMGKRVLVPFGRRQMTGYIVSVHQSPSDDIKKLRSIIDIIDPVPLFDETRGKFYSWLSSYYFAPIGEAIDLICPAPVAIKSRRILRITPKGEAALDNATGLAGEILQAANPGASISTLVKRFKGKAVYAAVERLKADGCLVEEEASRAGAAAAFDDYVAAVPIDTQTLEKLSKRSPAQAKVFKYLLDTGELTTRRLTELLGDVTAALRALLKKGFVSSRKVRALRDPLAALSPRHSRFEPNAEQTSAIDAIIDAFKAGGYAPFLLYGVTGSGKTLVYLNALEEVVKAGKKALFLTPEIALTPWPAAYLAARFPGRVAVAHSGLKPGERLDEWERILSGAVDVVVGARSALFTPLDNIGMIIVDEEHETSYKQDDGVRYNARDAALMLGKMLGITVVLGSATPSVETFYNARAGKLTPLYLRKRVEERPLPAIEILDMKTEPREIISAQLKNLLAETFVKGGQSLLLLNRRGFSNFIICRDCGNTFQCRNCSVTMTMHKGEAMLKCHYCDLSMHIPSVCPRCKGTRLVQPGLGTERLEDEVKALWPQASVARMDRDTTRGRGSAQAIIDAVEGKRIDCLVGTQMVSKGHHFPGITLVGVISGDTSLNMPDFRAAERTFQLITQAAGRAGRGAEPGRVIIQTLNPKHFCFTSASKNDYEGFFNEELKGREDAVYPPFSRLCSLRIEGVKEAAVVAAADELRLVATRLLANGAGGLRVLGPAPAPLARLKGRYRHQMLVKAAGRANLKAMLALVGGLRDSFNARRHSNLTLIIDMDPSAIM